MSNTLTSKSTIDNLDKKDLVRRDTFAQKERTHSVIF